MRFSVRKGSLTVLRLISKFGGRNRFFLKEGQGQDFPFFSKNPFLAHFSITFLSAIQVLVWYKNLSYFFADTQWFINA